jgi:pimeloyl-ACP methyl ester carboxylesterase
MHPQSRLLRLPWQCHGAVSPVAVRLWGEDDPAAPAVVCVHGLSRNARDFDELAAALAPRFRVACIDMPGRGDSAWLEDASRYGSDTYLDVARFVIDSLGLGAVHWVGTSMGGLLGMRIAAQFPSRVRSLVMNDVGAELDGEELGRQRRSAGESVLLTDMAEADAYLRHRYAAFGIRSEKRWRDFVTTSVEAVPGGRLRLRFDTRAVPASPAAGSVSLWDQYLSLACPVLVLRGSLSKLLTAETCERMARSGLRAAWIEIPGAGHAPDLSGEERIAPVLEFMERCR